MFSDRLTCCVPGCGHSASRVSTPECIEVMCEDHYALASPAVLARRARREERLRALQQRWEDDAYFDRLPASAKHPQKCGRLSFAAEPAERAWMEVKAEVFAAARSPSAGEKISARAA